MAKSKKAKQEYHVSITNKICYFEGCEGLTHAMRQAHNLVDRNVFNVSKKEFDKINNLLHAISFSGNNTNHKQELSGILEALLSEEHDWSDHLLFMGMTNYSIKEIENKITIATTTHSYLRD